jgi:hypothetical protein
MASICNDEQVSFGVMSGHDRNTLSLSDEGCASRPTHRDRKASFAMSRRPLHCRLPAPIALRTWPKTISRFGGAGRARCGVAPRLCGSPHGARSALHRIPPCAPKTENYSGPCPNDAGQCAKQVNTKVATPPSALRHRSTVLSWGFAGVQHADLGSKCLFGFGIRRAAGTATCRLGIGKPLRFRCDCAGIARHGP